ncbi:MAG: cation transporter [Erysipelotrichaceae bacterium]|nr:cation transporter [Erysipelotrichaceae bacterium]
MDPERKSGYRTLLMSVLMSAYGPVILGLGLRVGHSSTQIADFVRRTAELLALIAALVVYTVSNRTENMDDARKSALERKGNLFTGIVMCVSGGSMLVLSALSAGGDKGNVVPALAIAVLGVAANSIFWRRYTVLYHRQGNAILGVQARLYGAKTAVDVCVTIALAAVLALPGTQAAFWLDKAGTLLVALYMIRCGIRTIQEQTGPGAGLQ